MRQRAWWLVCNLFLVMVVALPDMLFGAGGDRPDFKAPSLPPQDASKLAEFELRASQLGSVSDVAAQDQFATEAKECLGNPYVCSHALLLAGGVYQNGGRVSEALDFYRRTLVTAGDDYHRLVAIEAIVYLLRSRQRYDEALQEIDSFLTEFSPGQDTRSYLSLSRSQLLVRLQRIEEAVSGIQEKFKAGELTETHAGECLEEIAVDLLSGPGSLKSEEIYRWIMANLQKFQRNSRFLGNYAHVLETRGLLDEAIETRVLLIKEFPDDERRCEHLLEAANLLSSQGKYTEAIEYYERIEGLNARRDSDRAIKVLAKKNLESAKARNETSQAVKPIEDVPRSNSYQVILIVNLILVVVIGFAWFRARRRA